MHGHSPLDKMLQHSSGMCLTTCWLPFVLLRVDWRRCDGLCLVSCTTNRDDLSYRLTPVLHSLYSLSSPSQRFPPFLGLNIEDNIINSKTIFTYQKTGIKIWHSLFPEFERLEKTYNHDSHKIQSSLVSFMISFDPYFTSVVKIVHLLRTSLLKFWL